MFYDINLLFVNIFDTITQTVVVFNRSEAKDDFGFQFVGNLSRFLAKVNQTLKKEIKMNTI